MPDLRQLITQWGYTGIFVVAILGNIGLLVPEETMLVVAGYLVWSGRPQLTGSCPEPCGKSECVLR